MCVENTKTRPKTEGFEVCFCVCDVSLHNGALRKWLFFLVAIFP
jgi:hypothetical protein